jgi:hypothetical protein
MTASETILHGDNQNITETETFTISPYLLQNELETSPSLQIMPQLVGLAFKALRL